MKMKRFLIVLVVFALPTIVRAQCAGNDVCVGSDQIHSPSADEIGAQTYMRDQHNKALCEGVGLAASCTQAEYDAVVPTPPAAVVYTDNAARAYFMDKLKLDIAAAVSTWRTEQKSRATGVVWDAATQAARDGWCTQETGDADCVQ
jgi:hypothetical protein